MIMQILQSLWRLHQIEHEQAENIKRAEDKKKKTKKKSVSEKNRQKNADFYKPVLNKIMIMHE